MKLVRYFSVGTVIVALGLAAAGFSGGAVFFGALSVVVEVVGSTITGKQTNDTEL